MILISFLYSYIKYILIWKKLLSVSRYLAENINYNFNFEHEEIDHK